MFTWICPQCGREVPPAYDECPDCKERAAQQGQAAGAQAPPPQPPPEQAYQAPPYQPPPQYQQAPPPPQPPPPPQTNYPPPQYQQPQYQPPQHQPQGPYQPAPQQPQAQQPPQYYVRPYSAPPPVSKGLPVWLLTVLVALAVLGVVAGVVWTVSYFHNRPETKPSAVVESPAAKPGTATNPLQKYIEVAGVRFAEDPKHKEKTIARFLVINHSDAEIAGLKGNVTIWGSTRKSEEDAQGTFTFAADLKPMESMELTAPLNTKLKIYELPDWQNVTTDIQITSTASK
jgi:hypothetical protein